MDDKADIQKFWGALYASLYTGVESGLTREQLLPAIDALEDMFRLRRHGAVVEMPVDELAGRSVLEIGCGAGGHSVLFARRGAVMTSVDITPERVAATGRKFALLEGLIDPGCRAMSADAENLPFPDGSFDIVYSNGVLHHTHDTGRAIAEVYRVLKPGGLAVIMLYCKDSWHYWVNMLLFVGVLQGGLLRSRNWLGHATEWGGRDRQTVDNPITRCYTRSEMRDLFSAFRLQSLRKAEFYFYLIPKLGKLYRRWQVRRYGTHPGGLLVYGEPWPIQSPLEMKLGEIMGWAWYARAYKT
ncbi:MAG: class I SAM-dependent methyltransferase [Alphaproteobacteria bacterium]